MLRISLDTLCHFIIYGTAGTSLTDRVGDGEGVKQLELTSEKNLPKAKETLFSQAIIELHTGEYKKESFLRTDNDEISIPYEI